MQIDWLLENMNRDDDACVIWPFACAGGRKGDYGVVWFKREQDYAHRVVCEIANGPSNGLQAAHECGNTRCVNAKHIRWATPKENAADKVKHGRTNDGERQGIARFTNAEAAHARKLMASGVRQARIAEMYNVSRMAVSRLARGHTYKVA